MKAVYLTFGQVMKTAEIDRLIVRTPCVGIKRPNATVREEMHFFTESR